MWITVQSGGLFQDVLNTIPQGAIVLSEHPTQDRITVNLSEAFDPYRDTVSGKGGTQELLPEEREPFNDYVRHQDIIVGHQRNRTLSDYPRSVRPYVRLYAFIALAVFAVLVVGIIWDMFH